MNRGEVIWYYRLGGTTLGPVSWREIDEIILDTVNDDLLVARGGDTEWVRAAEVVRQHPELQWEIPDAAPEERFEAPEAEPSVAAREILGESPMSPYTGMPGPGPEAPPSYPEAEPVGPGGMRPVFGLGQWISQAWTMVTGDIASFALGMLLAAVVTLVTIGIAGPPLLAGMYVMALKRFRGEAISPGTVFEGFQYFLPAWGVVLLLAVANFALTAPLAVPAHILTQQGDGQAGAMLQMIANVWAQIVALAIAGAVFYAMVLVVDRKLGPIDAIKSSWETTKLQWLSYVGMAFILQLIAGAGVLACCVGVLVTAPMVPCAEVAVYMYHFRNR